MASQRENQAKAHAIGGGPKAICGSNAVDQNVTNAPIPDDDIIPGNDPNHDGAHKDWAVIFSGTVELTSWGSNGLDEGEMVVAWFETEEEAKKTADLFGELPLAVEVGIRHYNREEEEWDGKEEDGD